MKNKPAQRIPVILLAGYGYDGFDGANFDRLREDTPAHIAPDEYAMPGRVIAYRDSDGRRMHIPKQAVKA